MGLRWGLATRGGPRVPRILIPLALLTAAQAGSQADIEEAPPTSKSKSKPTLLCTVRAVPWRALRSAWSALACCALRLGALRMARVVPWS